jgi:hypothetical protein
VSQQIDLADGDAVKLILNGQTLNIKSNSDGTQFIISTLDNDLSITPDARNKIFISAMQQKMIKQ